MLKAKASDHASRGDQFSPSEQRPQAGISGGGRFNLGGDGMGGHNGGVTGGGMGHMGRMGGGGDGHMGPMARGDFNGGSNWHGRNFAHNGNFARNNWNGNWDRHHHFRNRFFVGAPFFYGGYYAYSGYGNCAWLRRQAIITGSPYWWERYQACLYY
jgi:hypothetical protein